MSNNAWKNEKRAMRRAAQEAADEARETEERRKHNLSMWERIEEADASEDIKKILHMLADHAGLEG